MGGVSSTQGAAWKIVDRDVDVFRSETPRGLLVVLRDADEMPAGRAIVAALGRELAQDGQWRSEIKHSEGWGGEKTAWTALTAEIGKRRVKSSGPWWWILEYAEGDKVSEEVTAFFATADERG